MATAVMNAPFLAPRPADWQFSQQHHQQQHQYISPMPSKPNETGKENHQGASSSSASHASGLKQLQQSTPTARPRRERPCDGCRRRKSKCVLQEARRCVLCEFHKQDCTFVENAQPRKRKVPDDAAAATAEQQRQAKKVSTTAPMNAANQQQQNQQKSLNGEVVRTDSHAASSPRRRLSSASQQYVGHANNSITTTTTTTTADLSSPITSSTTMPPMANSMPQVPFAVDESLSLQPHRHCKYLGHTTALDATLMSLNPFNAQHETTSRLGQIRRVTATEFFSTHDDSSVRIPADEARALAEIARIIAPPFSSSSNLDHEYQHEHEHEHDHDYHNERDSEHEHEHLIRSALISLYFLNVHPSYPIIQKRTFLDRLRRGDGAFNPPLLAAMYLLALPWWYSDQTLSRYPKPDERALERVAMGSLTVAMERPKISAVQAGLLLLQRGVNVSNSGSGGNNNNDGGGGNSSTSSSTGRPTSGSASPWTLTTQLVALGQEIGLHLDCTDWAIPLWERRLRKRLAWALYVQDKWAALVHGRPSHVHAADWAVLPLTEEDFDERTLEVDGVVGVSYGGGGGGVAAAGGESPTLFPALSPRPGSPAAAGSDNHESNDNSYANNPENVESKDTAIQNDFPSEEVPKIEADDEDDELELDLLSRGRDLFTNLISLTSIMADVVTAFYSQSALAEFRRVGWPRATQLVLLRAKPVQIRLKEWFARLPAEFKVDTAGGGTGGGNSMAGGVEVAAGALQLAYFATEITIHRRIVQSLAPPPQFDGREFVGGMVSSAGMSASAPVGAAVSVPGTTQAMQVDDGTSMGENMSPSGSEPSSPASGHLATASMSNGLHPSSPAAAQFQHQHPQQPHHQQSSTSQSQSILPHPDPNLLSICRSAAKHRLISAMDFTNRLTPSHLSSFWYFGSASNLALIGSFGALLQATSPGAEEAGFYAARLREFRWTLGVSVPRAEWVRGAIGLVEGVSGMLGSLGQKPWLGGGQTEGVGSNSSMIGLGGGGFELQHPHQMMKSEDIGCREFSGGHRWGA